MPFPAALPLESLTEADLADLDVDTLLYVVLDPTATALSRGIALATLTAYIGADYVPLAQRGAANGVATLDAGGLIPGAQLPPLALGETFTVASQAAMLALVAQRGDMAIRTDLDPDGFFLLTSDSPGTLADWKQILAPGSVVSVDGQTGAVSIVTQTITNGVTNRAPSEDAVFDALALKAPVVSAGTILALAHYNPSTQVNYNVTTSFADVDATNLAVTFTVPPSGAVIVEGMISSLVGANGIGVNLREGSSNIAGTEQIGNDQGGVGRYERNPFSFYVNGLTPGDVKTYKLGFVGNTNITSAVRVGGRGTTQIPGPGVLKVIAVP